MPVLVMLALFAMAAVLLHSTRFGQHLYAIGGNREAARFTGIPLVRTEIAVYVICSLLTAVAGMIHTAQLYSAEPASGVMFELNAIAAVVVGGTSLAGGEGRITGTLIGVFILAVVQNAMNLLGIGPYPQNVVLGLIVLGVVLLDTIKRNGWRVLMRPE